MFSISIFSLCFIFISIISILFFYFASASPHSDHSLDTFLQEGFLSAPTVKAVDEHPNSCLKIKGDRLVPYKPNNNNLKFRKGSAFVATDLCPMGHTAKDAPLLMSWALDAEGFTREELMSDVYHQHRHTNKKSKSDTKDYHHDEKKKTVVSSSLRSPPLRYLIYGNICMSKDRSIKPNKRTPVFHNVLWDWFKAVKKRLLTLRKLRKDLLQEGDENEQTDQKIEEIHFSDIESNNKDEVMCFENIVTRHEKWRWMREEYHADQFRIAMWSHFNVSDEFQKQKLENVIESKKNSKPSSSSSCAVSNDHSSNNHIISKLIEHLRPSKNARMIRDVEAKIKNTGGDEDRTESNKNNFNQEMHQRNLAYSLRSAFPSATLPLRVTVLVRDEDRHFEETKVAEYIEQQFGALVEVKQEKFDSIRGDKHYVPPTHKQQLQLLFDTDILVAAHGAGLSAVLAMRPGSAVIELFPHNFKYYMYEEASEISRIHYRRWESQIVWPKRCCSVSPGSRSEKAKFEKPMHLNGLGARGCKKCDTFVNEELVEELVAQAVREVMISHL